MTEYHPDNKEQTAKMRRTFQVKLAGDHTDIYPVHIPVVDLPQSMIDEMPPEDRYKAYDVHLMFCAVTLCLN